MDDDLEDTTNTDAPTTQRRSRRLALSELNDSVSSPETPANTSSNPDELIIAQRGPRRKPVTWSPVNYEFNKADLLGPPKSRTPEKKATKSDVNPKLRRRLIMSPTKHSAELGAFIAKKLRTLQTIGAK